MNKIRVYELAKLLGRANPELLDVLKELGIEVKSHSSSVDMEAAQRVEDYFKGGGVSGEHSGVTLKEKELKEKEEEEYPR